MSYVIVNILMTCLESANLFNHTVLHTHTHEVQEKKNQKANLSTLFVSTNLSLPCVGGFSITAALGPAQLLNHI